MTATARPSLWPRPETPHPFGGVFLQHARRSQPDPQLAHYQRDPIAWMVERMGVPAHTLVWSKNPGYRTHIWDGDRDPLVKIAMGLAAGKNVGVEAGTGTQKTHTAALLTLWFLSVFRNSIIPTEAPKEQQLTLHLWKEIGKLWPRFQRLHPAAELTQLRIRMVPGSDEWGAVGFPVGVGANEESATKAQGFHAEHMLIITEETPGMNGAVMTANEHTCTAPHNLRLGLGNPDSQQDELHKFCTQPGTVHVRISALDHPNVVTGKAGIVPGAASRPKVEERRLKYTDTGRLYLSRVRGIAPTEATDALVRLEWLLAARRKTAQERAALRQGPRALGVDVAASEHGDKAAIAEGEGGDLQSVTAHRCPDPNAFARLHVAPLIESGFRGMIAPERVGIDSVGVGAGSVNELVRLGHRVVPLNGGNSPIFVLGDSEKYENLRAQMCWQFREDARTGKLALPPEADPILDGDLTALTWGTRNGKIFVEKKENIIPLLGRSPDKGDAAIYWNWMRHHAGIRAPDPTAFQPARIHA